jgi:hypothetical protein
MSATTTMCPWRMRRLGIVMELDPADPREAGGVLNPAATRGPDGQLYLLPRLVAAGNYSRIGLARVLFNRRGTPVEVERLGVVLEPHAPDELNPDTGGGVEDARITYIAARGLYVMTRSSRDSNLTHPSTDQIASSGRRRPAGALSLSSTCEKRGEVLPWSREIETPQVVCLEHESFAASVVGRCGTLDTLPGVPQTAHSPARTAYPRGTQ